MLREISPVRFIIIVFLLLLACFAAYGSSLRNEFLIDDKVVVQQNNLIRSFSSIGQWFSQPFLKFYYRPMTYLSFSLDYAVWKLNPFGYHLTAVSLHFINSVLLFVLFYFLWGDFVLSTATAFLFAVHPINSITVNYVADRSNLLSALFMLSALISFCLASRRFFIQFCLAGFFFFLFALLSHENAILFPFYLFFVLRIAFKGSSIKKIIALTSIAFFISVSCFLLRTRFLNFSTEIFPHIKLFEYFHSFHFFFFLILKYISSVIFPMNICLIRTIDSAGVLGLKGIILALLIIGAVLSAIIKFRGSKIMLFSLVWLFIGILPLYTMMYSRPEMGLIMQDNWVYFTFIGAWSILGLCFRRLKMLIKTKIWFVSLAAIVFLYINISRDNSRLWRNELVYCSYWLKLTPRNPFAFNSLGVLSGMQGDYKKAKEYFFKGIDCFRIKKDNLLTDTLITGQSLGLLFVNLAVTSDKEGKIDEAIVYCHNALDADKHNADAHFLLGFFYSQKNDVDQAIFHYNESAKISFYRLDTHCNLAMLYLSKGDKERALKEVKIALSINPDCFKTFDKDKVESIKLFQ